jgi:LemA protein
MKKPQLAWLIVAGILFLLGMTFVSRYNRLVAERETVNSAWAQIQNVLQRRADLVPNLVESVKGYAGHEERIFREVAEARSRVLAAKGPAEASEANQGLQRSLYNLLAISERYPDLKANRNFLNLQDELSGTENRISVERKRYNDAVQGFNARLRSFPTRFWAPLLGFEAREYFETAAGAERAPLVEFTPLGQR